MPEQWFIRVEGREYGPADLITLQEWREEGRVLPHNEARRADIDRWMAAADIPGLFGGTGMPAPEALPTISDLPSAPRSIGRLLLDTVRIFKTGFPQYFGLSLLILTPSLCAQFTRVFLASFGKVDADLLGLLDAGVGVCMFVLFLVFWPIYIAGIQFLTRELAYGRRVGFFALLNDAVKFWPRIATLCVFVYGSYFCLTVVLITMVVTIGVGLPPAISFFLVLVLLALWIWIIGRLWVNFLFWQQFAVLDGLDVPGSLQESKRLARSRRDDVWFKRPIWRGAFLFSLWCLITAAFELPSIWPVMQDYFRQVATAPNPQALVEALQKSASTHGSNVLNVGLWSLQQVLKPLLGIAFVLFYLDLTTGAGEEE